MDSDFGPWATTLDMGPHASLSSFWQRRIAMLQFARHAGPRPSGRTTAVLILFAVFTLGAPMLSLSLSPAAMPEVAPVHASLARVAPVALPPSPLKRKSKSYRMGCRPQLFRPRQAKRG